MTDTPPAGVNAALWALLVEDIDERMNPIRLSPEAVEAYKALVTAMERHRPACSDDERFTTGQVAQMCHLASVCSLCPIRAECAAYADIARPPAGYWAGSNYQEEST